MDAIAPQLKIGELLNHVGSGNFRTFERILELASIDTRAHRFVVANYFFAMAMAGFIEVQSTDEQTTWWSSNLSAICVNGIQSKKIPASAEGWNRASAPSQSLILDHSGEELIGGWSAPREEGAVFGPGFRSRIPNFVEIESEICHPCEWPFESELGAEIYDFSKSTWRVCASFKGNELVRVRRRHGGYHFYVLIAGLRMAVRIKSTEWVHFAALNLLGRRPWIEHDEKGRLLRCNRSLRLPMPILRFLFASSSDVTIGAQIEFRGLEQDCAETFLNFLEPGYRHAS
jgi:hypothetical protein